MNTIDPKMFTFSLTYNIVLIVVLGGSGSISGSCFAAIVVTVSMEALRFLDGPLNLLFVQTQGLPGLRMVVFSLLLLLVIIYRQQGLMGNREFSWNLVLDSPLAKKLESRIKTRPASRNSNTTHDDSDSAHGGGHA
jgi:branched-chain amino acid transport system permease protein